MGSHSNPTPQQPVIVGVTPGQAPHIVLQAARFAAQFGAELVCAHVNPDRFAIAEKADGSISSAPIDPDYADEFERSLDDWLHRELNELLEHADITWRSVMLAGDIATALGRLADRIDAAMIVVGTHDNAFTGTLQELFNRSIATNLAHRQNRPVVVVPTRKRGETSPLLKDIT